MTVDKSQLAYLGFGDRESYGLSWRTEGSGGHIADSDVSHLYFGVYSFDVGGLSITGNDIHDSVLYGIDPHTGSHNLKIQNNVVHDNGKHGIILAEDCVDSDISGNIVYRNQHHGIVLYQHSDRNTIENNETFQNASQGININESGNNVIQGNKVYDNGESGIGIAQTGQDNALREQRRPRQQAGRRPDRERGHHDRAARQRDRPERPLRHLRRHRRPVHPGREHDLRQPHRRAAQGPVRAVAERQLDLRQPRGRHQERLTGDAPRPRPLMNGGARLGVAQSTGR